MAKSGRVLSPWLTSELSHVNRHIVSPAAASCSHSWRDVRDVRYFKTSWRYTEGVISLNVTSRE